MYGYSNHVGVKKQLITVPVNSFVPNYQVKIFFNGSNIQNLRSKIITSLQLFTNSELYRYDSSPIMDLTNTDFSTYLTLVGHDGKVILNLLPMTFLYNYSVNDVPEYGKELRQFLMLVDWQKSYLLLVWNASPVAGSVIAMMVGYVDNVAQLPEHVKANIS